MVQETATAIGLNNTPASEASAVVAVGLVGLLAIPAIKYLLNALAPDVSQGVVDALAIGAIASVSLTVLITGTADVIEAFGRHDLKAVGRSRAVPWRFLRPSSPLGRG